MSDENQKMFELAKAAYEKAYAKYSQFYVGVSVKVNEVFYSGCNIENASYGATICAERVAILKAISEEGPQARIEKLCLITKTGDYPCGLCLQVMSEFMSKDADVLICDEEEVLSTIKFGVLFPHQFEL